MTMTVSQFKFHSYKWCLVHGLFRKKYEQYNSVFSVKKKRCRSKRKRYRPFRLVDEYGEEVVFRTVRDIKGA